jgi:hypothetical protein
MWSAAGPTSRTEICWGPVHRAEIDTHKHLRRLGFAENGVVTNARFAGDLIAELIEYGELADTRPCFQNGGPTFFSSPGTPCGQCQLQSAELVWSKAGEAAISSGWRRAGPRRVRAADSGPGIYAGENDDERSLTSHARIWASELN